MTRTTVIVAASDVVAWYGWRGTGDLRYNPDTKQGYMYGALIFKTADGLQIELEGTSEEIVALVGRIRGAFPTDSLP